MLRDELEQIKAGIADHQAVIAGLTKDWIDGRIDKAEYDERIDEPSELSADLWTRRRELQTRPLTSLVGDDLNALIVDLFECRRDAIERKKAVREHGSSRDVVAYQQRVQKVADEVEWYTVRLEEIGKLGGSMDPMMVWADCRHCGHRIAQLNHDGGVWLHCTIEGMPLPFWGGRGCRAASFDRDGDWNDALPRDRSAAPDKKTVVSTVPLLLGRSFA